MARRKSSSAPPKLSGYTFDEAEADRAVAFFEQYLTHVKGKLAGQPFTLQQWQRDEIIRPLFGWKRADGSRRYRRAYIEIPRKSGKSTICAGIGLKLLFDDGEAGAEIYSAAADREQASIVFEVAKGMVDQSEDLRGMAQLFRKSIVAGASSYKTLSADAYTKHGLNAHGIIFDELHAQPNRELWDVLTTSTGARSQPLIVAITTAGYDRHSICWEQREYAIGVRDGVINDPSFLPVIYGADTADDWTSPTVWAKANPGIDVTISRDYLEAECERAKNTPSYENTFRRLHLNQWTEQSVRWLPMDKWDACGDEVPDMRRKRCFAGLDLSTTTDLSALVLVFVDDEADRIDVRAWVWIPEEGIRRRSERDRVPYAEWAKAGLVEPTPGAVVDYEIIRQRIHEIADDYELAEIAVDPWNSQQLRTQLENDGLTIVEHRQGFASMSAPSKDLEAMVMSGRLRHGGNPVLRWAAGNVAVRSDPAGNIKPDKERSTERIDPIVALVMAISRAVSPQEMAPRNPYRDGRDLVFA